MSPSTKRTPKPKGFYSSALRIGQSYYFNVPVGNLDGTIDLETWKPTYQGTLKEALDTAVEGTGGDGMTEVVFECRPVYKVSRGKVKVTKLK